MIFTSYTYVYFLLCLLALHRILPSGWRQVLLVAASLIFYVAFRWEFGFLLVATAVFNWAWGRWALPPASSGRRLAGGVIVNLLPLVYFKYTGFVLDNLEAAAGLVGIAIHPAVPAIALPVGISFFTFQAIAYLVDVAAGEAPFVRFRDFLLYRAFWPQLSAGPIIRPGEIRDQVEAPPASTGADLAAGGRRVVIGLFKKVVLADTLAPYVDQAFATQSIPGFVDAVAAVVGFGLQVYLDFSAYSDIAIGSARLFGFRFPENFDWPYLARSPQEFWQRWHMTLSRWIRDYLFAPLNFMSRRTPRLSVVWLFFSMVLCGLWHGAAWTFVLWGAWHGLLLVLNQTVLKRVFPGPGRRPWSGRDWLGLALTYTLVTAGWLLFRAESLAQIGSFATAVLTVRGGLRPSVIRENGILLIGAIGAAVALTQFLGPRLRATANRWDAGNARRLVIEPLAYAGMIAATIVFDREARAFVYFQF